MSDKKNQIKLFEGAQVRAIWDEEAEKWWFSIADICSILADSADGRKYWSVLKTRLKKEGSELATNCSQLKMQAADGKMYLTDVAKRRNCNQLTKCKTTWATKKPKANHQKHHA